MPSTLPANLPSAPAPIGAPHNIHATCIAISGRGILLLGPSGAGKSDLALRLIDRGAILVADDRCDIWSDDQETWAAAPANLAGMMEVRGLGLINEAFLPQAPLSLAVLLQSSYDRFPLGGLERQVAGHPIVMLRLNAFEPSTPIKIERMLKQIWPDHR